ncbi:hypothetical protein FGO68_gene9656 [Halteria grandinella]|uniref:Uncharacterized protein n=1 Tax=Halteria grandinella TaxID=5974 RepID=A0A8J8T3P5_HALGN|nr:hypothetical protein FGO68_gene9656 [Halteria grandinella]
MADPYDPQLAIELAFCIRHLQKNLRIDRENLKVRIQITNAILEDAYTAQTCKVISSNFKEEFIDQNEDGKNKNNVDEGFTADNQIEINFTRNKNPFEHQLDGGLQVCFETSLHMLFVNEKQQLINKDPRGTKDPEMTYENIFVIGDLALSALCEDKSDFTQEKFITSLIDNLFCIGRNLEADSSMPLAMDRFQALNMAPQLVTLINGETYVEAIDQNPMFILVKPPKNQSEEAKHLRQRRLQAFDSHLCCVNCLSPAKCCHMCNYFYCYFPWCILYSCKDRFCIKIPCCLCEAQQCVCLGCLCIDCQIASSISQSPFNAHKNKRKLINSHASVTHSEGHATQGSSQVSDIDHVFPPAFIRALIYSQPQCCEGCLL